MTSTIEFRRTKTPTIAIDPSYGKLAKIPDENSFKKALEAEKAAILRNSKTSKEEKNIEIEAKEKQDKKSKEYAHKFAGMFVSSFWKSIYEESLDDIEDEEGMFSKSKTEKTLYPILIDNYVQSSGKLPMEDKLYEKLSKEVGEK